MARTIIQMIKEENLCKTELEEILGETKNKIWDMERTEKIMELEEEIKRLKNSKVEEDKWGGHGEDCDCGTCFYENR